MNELEEWIKYGLQLLASLASPAVSLVNLRKMKEKKLSSLRMQIKTPILFRGVSYVTI
jgi:hypothetical protein